MPTQGGMGQVKGRQEIRHSTSHVASVARSRKATAMTPEQIAAIAARNEARTQGKWTHTTYLSGTQNVEFPGSRGVAVVNSVNDHDNKPIANSVLCLPPTHMAVSQRLEDYGRDDDHQRFHNGQFIAHASEDIPSLLAEVARLTAALAEAESVNSEFSWEYAAQIAERFGVNESDRRKFGNEMAEVFRAMGAP